VKVIVSRQQRRAAERAARRSERSETTRAVRLEQKLRSPQALRQRQEIGEVFAGVALLFVSVTFPPIGRLAQGMLTVARGLSNWLRSRSKP